MKSVLNSVQISRQFHTLKLSNDKLGLSPGFQSFVFNSKNFGVAAQGKLRYCEKL